MLCLLAVSCDIVDTIDDNPDFGIPVYEIEISDENYSRLNSNIFTNLSVPAEMTIDGKSYSITIEHQGWTSRELYKKSYEINYSSDKDPILERKEIILSSQVIDPSMIKSLLAHDAFEKAGFSSYKTTPVYLYINNEGKGLYLLTEPINEEYFAARNREIGELYKAINTQAQFSMIDGFSPSEGFQKRIPDDENYHSLKSLITLLDTEHSSTLPVKLEKVFNVDKYLRYCAVTKLIGNWDGIVHNFYLLKDKTTNIIEFVPWDLDRTFSTYNGGAINLNSNLLFDKILAVPEYNTMYSAILKEISENNYTIDFCLEKIDEYKNLISEAYNSDRWLKANGYNLETEVEKIRSFILSRNDNIQY